MSQSPKTPDAHAGESTSSTRKSPAPNCVICLDPIPQNTKCFAYSCLHAFCYGCLTKWMECKNDCPLCKRRLEQIIYDVQSPGTYKTRYFGDGRHDEELFYESEDDNELSPVQALVPSPPPIMTPSIWALFGYPSASIGGFQIRYGLYEHQIPERTTCLQWRRFCYEYNLYAVSENRPIDDYRQNADKLNELRRWVHREIQALSNVVDAIITPQQIETVLLVVGQCDITSPAFLNNLPPLEPKTDHFMHELMSFAHSEHNNSVEEYDANVLYDFRSPDNDNDAYPDSIHETDDTSSDSSSDNSQQSIMILSSDSDTEEFEESSGTDAGSEADASTSSTEDTSTSISDAGIIVIDSDSN